VDEIDGFDRNLLYNRVNEPKVKMGYSDNIGVLGSVGDLEDRP
jgi:hypothetical protein